MQNKGTFSAIYLQKGQKVLNKAVYQPVLPYNDSAMKLMICRKNSFIRAERSKAEGFAKRSEFKIFQVAIWTYKLGAFFGAILAIWGPNFVV